MSHCRILAYSTFILAAVLCPTALLCLHATIGTSKQTRVPSETHPAPNLRFNRPQASLSTRTSAAAALSAVYPHTAARSSLRLSASTPSNIPITYTNPAAGYVSLAICKQDGEIVRTLLAKQKRAAGAHTEMWDGLDDNGRPAAAGDYLIKGLTHPGITPHFVTSLMNSGSPSWRTADGQGSWGGDLGNPIGATSDGEGNTYLLWTLNESGSYLIRVDGTGRKSWGASFPSGIFSGRATALAYDNGLVYVAIDGLGATESAPNHGGLILYDARTGRRKEFANGKPSLAISEWPRKMMETVVSVQTPHDQLKGGSFSYDDLGADLVGLAIGPDRIFCSLFLESKILVLDKRSYSLLNTYSIPQPGALAYDSARKILYTITGQGIIYLDMANSKPAAMEGILNLGPRWVDFSTTALEYPYGLALDSHGLLWVSARGHQMQVFGFDRDGKIIRRIGLVGGRPWEGKYDRRSMLMPAGISVDAHDHLWITESDSMPRRISLWDTRTGNLISEFFGGAEYAPMMAPDPDNPEEVYIHNTRFLVDYEKGVVSPSATIYRQNFDGPDIPGSESGSGFTGNTFQISTFRGRRMAYNGHGGVFATGKDRFRALFYVGPPVPGISSMEADDPTKTSFVWTDGNRDGVVAVDEVIPIKNVNLTAANIAHFGGAFFPDAVFVEGGKIFRPTGFSRKGVPLYPRPEDAPTIRPPANSPMGRYSNWLDVWPALGTDWKKLYAIASLPIKPGSREGEGGIYKFTPEGKILWRYNRVIVPSEKPGLEDPASENLTENAPPVTTGDLYGALRIAGEADLPAENGGQIIGIGCEPGYFGFLNEDGLFIDQVGQDNRQAPAPSFDTFFAKNLSGYFFRHPRTGKLYLFCGDTDGRILELTGWDKIQRFSGKIKVGEQG